MSSILTRGSLVSPRFGTIRRPERRTLGAQAHEISRHLLRPLMPWQRHVADVALELDENGRFAYNEVNLVVGRQQGKTELKFVIAVMRLTAMVASHGPQRVTYTMQDRKKARTRLERDYAVRLRLGNGFREMGHWRERPQFQSEWRLSLSSGAESIRFGPASWLQIDTPSRVGGHGDTLDLGLIDEAFAHVDDRVEQGMEPTMLTRRDAQLWVLSTAGDAQSFYLWRKILRGRQLAESGEVSTVAYFEWSAPDEAEPGDPQTWATACPALGYTVTQSRMKGLWTKASHGGPVAVEAFRRAYLCQWPEIPLLDEQVAFRVLAREAWQSCGDPVHRPEASPVYALDVDVNAAGEEWCSVAISDGRHCELVTPQDVGPGVGWVVDRAVAAGVAELVVDPSGPAGKLIGALEVAGIVVRKVSAAEFAQASQQFADAVAAGSVRHVDQPRLNRAVAGVMKRDVGDGGWRFSRKLSAVDIGPLVAVALARWAAVSMLTPAPMIYTGR